jgi:hypothetical protein
MSLSGRYPEHDICENFNAIDVRELQRKTQMRPGLCFIKAWFRNGAPSGEVSIFTQSDAVILVHRACPPGATESRIVELQVTIVWTKCHLGGRRPWFKCLTTVNGEVCGRRVAKLYGPCFACRRCLGLRYETMGGPMGCAIETSCNAGPVRRPLRQYPGWRDRQARTRATFTAPRK